MVDYPYPAEFMMPLPGRPIREEIDLTSGCFWEIVWFAGGLMRVLQGLVFLSAYEGANVYYNYTGEAKCFDLDDDPHGLGGWDWQACTEMVMPMSSSQESSMFPPHEYNYSSFEEECIKDFGVKPRPKWITTEFGGH
ncbi:Peptidase S28, partial [Sesbania bispinosa]